MLKMQKICVITVFALIFGSTFATSVNKRKLQDDFSRLLKWEPVVFAESWTSSWFKEKVPATTLKTIFQSVGPKTFFANRFKNHREAVELLANILAEQGTVEDVLKVAATLRNMPQINSKLWVQAFITAKVARDDMKFLRMPSLVELIPDDFLPREIFEQAANLQQDDCIVLDENFTNDNGIENALWYFREDLQANSHHWFWHTFFLPASSDLVSRQDRRAELFYFMHHEFLARYATERMTAGLNRIEALKQDTVTPMEGYSSHLTDRNSLMNYFDREPNMPLKDVAMLVEPGVWFNLTVSGSAALQELLTSDIRSGFLIEANGTLIPLDGFSGIDILSDAVESSIWSVNPERYSPVGLMQGFHNNGHGMITVVVSPLIIDPINDYKPGVMGVTSTSLRDPVFYRLHLAVENLFLEHKNLLTPYSPNENSEFQLKWDDISIIDVKVIPENGTPNELKTVWNYKQFNFSRGLDYLLNGTTSPPVAICAKHLDHVAFDYEINVETSNTNETDATVRIFLARRYDENMKRFSMDEQRKLFFTLDQFSIKLTPGFNKIVRSSRNSSLTIPFESWLDVEDDSDIQFQNCGCGWPAHLLLPRGSATGTSYDIFVMITPGNEDTDDSSYNDGECSIAPLWCGVRDKPYPSTYPAGYPFDRRPFDIVDSSGVVRVVDNLDEYIEGIPNMGTTRIRIQHLET